MRVVALTQQQKRAKKDEDWRLTLRNTSAAKLRLAKPQTEATPEALAPTPVPVTEQALATLAAKIRIMKREEPATAQGAVKREASPSPSSAPVPAPVTEQPAPAPVTEQLAPTAPMASGSARETRAARKQQDVKDKEGARRVQDDFERRFGKDVADARKENLKRKNQLKKEKKKKNNDRELTPITKLPGPNNEHHKARKAEKRERLNRVRSGEMFF